VAEVEIYTGAFCGYCSRAKRLLDTKGVPYTEISVTFEVGRRAEMVERSGGRDTVPQVFIDGVHIGGSDDLARLEAHGRLDPLLNSDTG
jgi:glutaredoxin 3